MFGDLLSVHLGGLVHCGAVVILTLGEASFQNWGTFDHVYFFSFRTWSLLKIQLWLDIVNANPIRF